MLQATEHVLLPHVAVAFAMPVAQGVEHAPQLAWLVAVLTHMPLQSVGVLIGQPETHTPPEHTGVPPLHPCPQVPQLFMSFWVSTSQPSACVLPLQLA